jgi:hypothetical protein
VLVGSNLGAIAMTARMDFLHPGPPRAYWISKVAVRCRPMVTMVMQPVLATTELRACAQAALRLCGNRLGASAVSCAHSPFIAA